MFKISEILENTTLRISEIIDPNYYFQEKAENEKTFEKIQSFPTFFSHIAFLAFLTFCLIKYKITNR